MYDAIVIGAGSGGLTSALGLAGLGKKVLLIEKHKMGGDCTNYGCIPSKSLINYGKDVAVLKKYGYEIDGKLAEKGLHITRGKVDEVLSHESPEVLMKKYKSLKVILGEAKFVSKSEVEVNEKVYKAKNIIIATGSEPRVVNIEGLLEEDLLTNKSVFDLQKLPEKLMIVGGGVIACELGEAFQNLGSEVTLVVRGDKLLDKYEPEVSKAVLAGLERKGVTVMFKSTIKSVKGKRALVGKKEYEFDKILMAVGRVVNLKSLNLEKAGVKYDMNGIKTNKKGRTSTRHIYAVGDVASQVKLTHNADHQGRVVVKDILLPLYVPKRKSIPKVVFMENEVASVGLSFEEAKNKYNDDEIFKIELDLDKVDRSLTDGTSGIVILVVKGLKGKILGANIYGPHAGEMISLIGVAIDNTLSLHALGGSVYAYPTYSRIFKKIHDEFLRMISNEWKPYLKSFFISRLPQIFTVLFWLALIVGFYFYKRETGLSNLDLVKEMHNFMVGTVYGPLLYIIIYTLRPIIFFPGSPVTIISGVLFGPIWGSIYTIIGANLSASVAYGLGRFAGGDIIGEDENLIGRWKKKLKDNSFESVLIMRLIYLPFDGVGYVCGLLKIKWIQYALATFLGILPGIITFVSFGSSIENLNEFDLSMVEVDGNILAISIVLFISSLVIARLIRGKYNIEKK